MRLYSKRYTTRPKARDTGLLDRDAVTTRLTLRVGPDQFDSVHRMGVEEDGG
jgi:hypothetical protein